jgi:hypothetical protein
LTKGAFGAGSEPDWHGTARSRASLKTEREKMAMDYKVIKQFIQQICDCAVEALPRFCELMDLPATEMHESSLVSYVFDCIGEKISLEPELMAKTIWQWNHNGKPTPPGVKRQQRIDLTLFEPQDVPKNDQHPLCFIEFKRHGNVDNDYRKLKDLTRLLECPIGAACGIDRNAADLPRWLQETMPAGERFVVSKEWEFAKTQTRLVVFSKLFATAPPHDASPVS